VLGASDVGASVLGASLLDEPPSSPPQAARPMAKAAVINIGANFLFVLFMYSSLRVGPGWPMRRP
jgi:hypothetical protein